MPSRVSTNYANHVVYVHVYVHVYVYVFIGRFINALGQGKQRNKLSPVAGVPWIHGQHSGAVQPHGFTPSYGLAAMPLLPGLHSTHAGYSIKEVIV